MGHPALAGRRVARSAAVAPGVRTDGPADELTEPMRSTVRSEVPAMTDPDWVDPRDLVAALSAGLRRRLPGRSATARPTSTACCRIVEWFDHAVELGCSGIALGPMFASRTHGYDTTDHYRIDPRLGDDADFDRLVAEAHRRGLRVLLDGVFNHVGTDFPRYRAALDGVTRTGSAAATTGSRPSRGTAN